MTRGSTAANQLAGVRVVASATEPPGSLGHRAGSVRRSLGWHALQVTALVLLVTTGLVVNSSEALADVNGNGPTTSTSSPATLLSSASLSASPYHDYSLASTNYYGYNVIASGDLRGTGHQDLVVGGAAGVNVFLNKGDGTFGPDHVYDSAHAYDAVAVADLNGDGIPDIIGTNYSSSGNTVTILPGKGDGTFGDPQVITVPLGTYAYAVAVADLDLDGDQDFVVATDTGVVPYYNNGHGTFTEGTPQNYMVGNSQVSISAGNGMTIANFNGYPDVVVGGVGIEGGGFCNTCNGVDEFQTHGSGVLDGANYIPLGNDYQSFPHPVAADVNGDGLPDLVAQMGGCNGYGGNSGRFVVALNNDAGGFTELPNQQGASCGADIAAADMNGDGVQDVISPQGAPDGVSGVVSLGHGDGTFVQAANSLPTNPNFARIAAVDVDGDGTPDVVADNGGQIRVILNTNPRQWAPPGCRPALRANGTPKYVLILADGIGSETAGGSYTPLDTTSPPWGALSTGYCFTTTENPDGYQYEDTGYSFMPRPLQSIVQDYLKGADPSLEPRLLTNVLGAEGVVILPFSYKGAILSGPSNDPFLRVQHAGDSVPGDVLPQAEADVLNQEVLSVHSVWKNARIIIVGHSEGGLVAETWWYHTGRFMVRNGTSSAGVAAVFSLDSPINGVGLGAACAPAAGLCALGHVGPLLGLYYTGLWQLAETRDQEILKAEDGAYIAVGTEGDPLYDAADIGWGIRSQLLLAGTGCFSDLLTGTCDPEGLDFFSNCYPSQAANQHFWNDPVGGHGLVMDCANVINYIGCVFLGQNPGCALPQAAGYPSRAALARSATPTPTPGGHISPTALAAGQTAVITGQGLGAAQGQVLCNTAGGMPASAAVQSWSDTKVTVTVPPSASTGPVELITSAGVPTGVGDITVVGAPGPVTAITATTGPTVQIGHPATIHVTATNSAGQPVGNIPVHLSDGLSTRSATTDAHGHTAFRTIAAAPVVYTAYAGSAFAQVTVTGRPLRPMSMGLRSFPPARGEVRIHATLRYTDGKPAVDKHVSFALFGSQGPALTALETTTNAQGVASAAITRFSRAPLVLTATATLAEATLEFNQPTSINLTSPANPAHAGKLKFTATITPIPRRGTVAFRIGRKIIATCSALSISARGTATCVIPLPRPGTYTITAHYSGDKTWYWSPSASRLIEVIGS